jgi:flagellar biosynthesis GTPase FlhF
MGCESNNEYRKNSNKPSIFNAKVINENFDNYVFGDYKIIDNIGKKYNENDKIFQILRKEEKDILFKEFYKSKKNDFQNYMYLYLKKQNLNFATTLTKQILTNENAIKIFDTKIKEEIGQLKQNESFLKIDYLTIMILGVTGVGK